MLSTASKRSISIGNHCRGIRKVVGSSTLPFTRNLQCSRLTTVSTPASSSNHGLKSKRIVISRRAWLDFKESRGITRKRPDATKRKKSDDEKPWPRNAQIAAYAASATAVPYIVLWTITLSPTLREWFGPIIPLEKLRTYYGKLEWDAQSYSEEMENKDTQRNPEESLNGYYQFPGEDSFNVRRQQEIIKNMNESDITVTVTLSSQSSPAEEIVTETVPANMIANEKNLLELFASGPVSTNSNKCVGIDFLDRNNPEDNATESSTGSKDKETVSDGSLMTDAESMANKTRYIGPSEPLSMIQQLAKKTQSMSIWTHVPQQQDSGDGSNQGAGGSGNVGAQKLTDVEMRMGQLEYEIAELKKSLRDPMCTRSIDDITTELHGAKRDLAKLRWKRRFGLI